MIPIDDTPLKCYKVDCQRFPGNDAVQITLTPVDEEDSCYNIECIDEDTALKILDMVGFSTKDPEKEVVHPDIENLIDFVLDFSGEESNILISESIRVTNPLLINNKVIEEGVITFFHKGRI